MDQIVLNLYCNRQSDCKYPILREIAAEFSFKVSESEDASDSDIIWHDSSITPDRLSHLTPHQKINHFPGMSGIFRKNTMANHLNRFQKLFPNEYNFYPSTFVLPGDMQKFKLQLKKRKTFIIKPEAGSQGQGIYLVKKLEDLQETAHCVAQEYLTRPLLLDSLKFDMRIYVLVTGCGPLRIFIHEEGLARFATEKYVTPNKFNLDDMYMHLTNYSINKNSPEFIQAEAGKRSHKRSLSNVLIVISN